MSAKDRAHKNAGNIDRPPCKKLGVQFNADFFYLSGGKLVGYTGRVGGRAHSLTAAAHYGVSKRVQYRLGAIRQIFSNYLRPQQGLFNLLFFRGLDFLADQGFHIGLSLEKRLHKVHHRGNHMLCG